MGNESSKKNSQKARPWSELLEWKLEDYEAPWECVKQLAVMYIMMSKDWSGTLQCYIGMELVNMLEFKIAYRMKKAFDTENKKKLGTKRGWIGAAALMYGLAAIMCHIDGQMENLVFALKRGYEKAEKKVANNKAIFDTAKLINKITGDILGIPSGLSDVVGLAIN
eukprot:UN03345